MVRYKTEADDREQRVLAEISLNTPVNRKKRKSTATVSVILSVIYAAFSAWLFARGVKANGFLLLGFALVFLLIALFSKKFQLFIVLRLMKKRNKALAGKTVEYAIDGEQDGYIYLVRLDNNVVLIDKSRLSPEELKELESLRGNVKTTEK